MTVQVSDFEITNLLNDDASIHIKDNDGIDKRMLANVLSTTLLEKFGIFKGTGSPEGVVTYGVGGLYLREDGGANTTLYIKESGVGNTGWVAK